MHINKISNSYNYQNYQQKSPSFKKDTIRTVLAAFAFPAIVNAVGWGIYLPLTQSNKTPVDNSIENYDATENRVITPEEELLEQENANEIQFQEPLIRYI